MATDPLPALIGLGGVVVGAALVWAKEAIGLRINRKKHARYLAVRVICTLDEYSDQCAAVANDEGKWDELGFLVPRLTEPEPPSFPNDVDWKSIDHQLVYRIFSISIKAINLKKKLDYISMEFGLDFWNKVEDRRIGYARLGFESICITDQLRKLHNIPKREGFPSKSKTALLAIIGEIEMTQQLREKDDQTGKQLNC